MADIFLAEMVVADMVCGRYRRPPIHLPTYVEQKCRPKNAASEMHEITLEHKFGVLPNFRVPRLPPPLKVLRLYSVYYAYYK